jgi:hypothetical protein
MYLKVSKLVFGSPRTDRRLALEEIRRLITDEEARKVLKGKHARDDTETWVSDRFRLRYRVARQLTLFASDRCP